MTAAFTGLGGIFWVLGGVAAFNEHTALTVFFCATALALWETTTESVVSARLDKLIEGQFLVTTPGVRSLVAINDRLELMDQRLVDIRSELAVASADP